MDFVFFGLTFILMGVRSPTVLRLGVLILSFILSLSLFIKFTRWFRFVLFLLYIGGIIVIIIYFSTLIPNQVIRLKKEGYFSLLFIIGLIGVLFSNNLGLKRVGGSIVDRVALYEGGTIYLSLGLLVFLFVLIVLVVVVTRFFGAPLRPLK